MTNFPNSWWKGRPLVFAHRGARQLAPENTMASFSKAVEVGADGIELDVRLTRDGIPVIMHNADVTQTTDGIGPVQEFDLEEIKKLDAGSWFDPVYTNLKVPTLEEVLDTYGHKTLINIELKAEGKKGLPLTEAVCKLVQKTNTVDHVWFSSFNTFVLRQTRKILPAVPNGYLYSVHTAFKDITISSLPIEAVHPFYRCINRNYVSRMHKRNKKVVAWTVDDETIAQKIADLNVDIIISNVPDRLLQALG